MSTTSAEGTPAGSTPVAGVVNRRSRYGVTETADRLAKAITGAGAKVFCRIDQSSEAQAVGLSLRPTTLLVFGDPAVGTAVMDAVPLAALDLPLKLLVWADDAGDTWTTYLEAQWLADRYEVAAELRPRLGAPAAIAAPLTATEKG